MLISHFHRVGAASRAVMCGVFVIAMLGCQSQQSVPTAEGTAVLDFTADSPHVTVVEGADPSQEQQDAMLAAKDELQQRLSGRLMEAMMMSGPADAVNVCSEEAEKIAADVGLEHGVKIGRVGVRLRNPQNTPPAWAKSFTDAQVDTPTFVSLSNDHTAALLPIKLQPQCLICHGPTEQIAPAIQQQIANLYPDDAATGFQAGELRGWFWVERL